MDNKTQLHGSLKKIMALNKSPMRRCNYKVGEDTQRRRKSMVTVQLFLFPLCLLWHSVVWRVQVIRKKVQNSIVPLRNREVTHITRPRSLECHHFHKKKLFYIPLCIMLIDV